jgi:hypothetical protein
MAQDPPERIALRMSPQLPSQTEIEAPCWTAWSETFRPRSISIPASWAQKGFRQSSPMQASITMPICFDSLEGCRVSAFLKIIFKKALLFARWSGSIKAVHNTRPSPRRSGHEEGLPCR